jgi:DNA-binding CsgD family transcriptional regulator
MAVDTDQAFEAGFAEEFGEATLAVVIATGEVELGEVEAALGEGEEGLTIRSLSPAELESSDDGHVYVVRGPSAAIPLAEVEVLVEQVPTPLVLVAPVGTTAKEMRIALRAGVAGIVREADVRSGLAATVRAVRGGQLVVPFDLGRQIAKPVLSRRQKQVLGLVVLGLSNGEVAAKLHLSEHTVKCHLYSGFRKLGVSSRDEAVATILDPESGLGTGILAISEAEPEVATHGHR